jgi:taurine---2-oxoglutarate transaminase
MTEEQSLSAREIVEKSTRYTLYDWQAQGKLSPIPVDRAEGVHFWDVEGKRYLDFNSQLMCTNVGHGHPRVIEAIKRQAETLAYANPFMATEPRARLGAKLAELCPGDIDTFFFTNGGAEANENAVKIARFVTGRHKILARYRSYHGGTYGAITLTGDPRRWASEPGISGVIRVRDPYHGIARGWDDAGTALAELEEVIQLEGPSTIAAFILETVTGTNGILVPPDGYIAGVREICDRYGILLIADEVMAGFGRTGKWFAIDHWDVVPDPITMAKGLTSAYVQLGALGMRRKYAEHFENNVWYGGLTYNSHPLACATALATIEVYEEERLIERSARMGERLKVHLEQLEARHPSVGDTRSIGLFGIVELVRDPVTMEPMAPFNGTSDEMTALAMRFREDGLYTFVRWNTFFTNPPLTISEEEMAEGFAIIDRALEITDAAVA